MTSRILIMLISLHIYFKYKMYTGLPGFLGAQAED